MPPCRKGSALTSRPWEARPATMSKSLYTYIMTMGGPTCHHVGKALSTYINDHGRPSLPACRKGLCVFASSELITSPWKEPRSEVHTRASLLIDASYKMQARSIKSNSSFQKKHTTSQIAKQVATYFASAVLSAMQDSILPSQ